jgi:hypothetical protein
MKLIAIAFACLLALQGCSDTSGGVAAGPSDLAVARGTGTGRCAPVDGRPSPFLSCRSE